MIFSVFSEIEEWGKSRNLYEAGYDLKEEIRKDVEETFELMGMAKDDVNVSTVEFMDYYESNGGLLNSPTDEEKVDAHCDKIVFAVNAIISLGYDPEQCMAETIKEISSRVQCDKQKADWARNGANGKWKKNPNQNPDTLYKADYESCKR